MSKSPRALARLISTGVAAAALVVVPAIGASAHVRVVPESTAAGSWTALTFRVPTESETASTTGLAVELPTATPFLHVSVRPVPGWSASVEEGDLPEPVEIDGTTVTRAPLRVVWTATGDAAVAPGQFQEFAISAGPLPDEGTTVVLPAAQTYSDGTVVRWADVPTGDDEPEHPAPVFKVTAADGSAHGAGADEHGAATPGATAAQGWSDPVARGLGAGALVLGAAAVMLALTGRRRAAREER